MDVLKSINESIPELSKGQKMVAYYILENWQAVAYKSARTLAEELSVSQSTILRTANQLGYDGFPALQQALQDVINEKVSTLARLELSAEENQGTVADEIVKVFRLHEANLQQTFQQIDAEQVNRVAALLINAGQVAVLGMRTSATVAHCLGYNLSFVRGNVQVFNSDYMLVEHLASMKSSDVVVVISFSRYSLTAVGGAKLAQKKQCKVVAITDSLTSPLVAVADECFVVPTVSRHINHSHMTAVAIVDSILTLVTMLGRQEARKKLMEIEAGVESLQIFSPGQLE